MRLAVAHPRRQLSYYHPKHTLELFFQSSAPGLNSSNAVSIVGVLIQVYCPDPKDKLLKTCDLPLAQGQPFVAKLVGSLKIFGAGRTSIAPSVTDQHVDVEFGFFG